jgi:DNA-binding XRE family transcriptional regulator
MPYTIKQARMLNDKTQKEMADLLCIDRGTYRKIELYPDKATVAQAKAISTITNIPVDQIFFSS